MQDMGLSAVSECWLAGSPVARLFANANTTSLWTRPLGSEPEGKRLRHAKHLVIDVFDQNLLTTCFSQTDDARGAKRLKSM